MQDCKTFAIPQNYIDVKHEKLFSGQLPTGIVVALVDNRAFLTEIESTIMRSISIIIIYPRFRCTWTNNSSTP